MPKVVGLLIDLLEDEYQNQILMGVEAAAREHDVSLICFVGGTLEANDRFAFGRHRNFIYELARSKSIDGLIVSAGSLGNAIGRERLADYCRRFKDQALCTFAVPLPGIPCVSVDNSSGMRAAVESLVCERELRRVALIRGPIENPEAHQRYEIYCEVLRNNAVPVDERLVVFGDFTIHSGARATRQLLSLQERPQAIVASNDPMALGALQEILATGLRVPEDIALVGFDDISEARFAAVPLSTVRQPIRRVGREALEKLVKVMNGESVPQLTRLGTEFVPRRSSGAEGELAVPSSIVPGNTVHETLAGRHAYLASRLSELTSASRALLQAFAVSIESVSPELLRSGVLAVAMRAIGGGEDSGVWQTALDTLRADCTAYASYHPELAQFGGEVWDDLRIAISEVGEGAQARRVLDLRQQLRSVRRVGEGLLNSLSPDRIMRLIAEQLPELGLASCHIALFSEARLSTEAELVLAWAGGSAEADLVPRRFASSSLVPNPAFYTDTRRSMVLEPLYFEEEELGFALCEMGPLDGVVYETLREQTSSALQRASLLRRLLEQTKLRQHAEADQLRKEVEIAANIQTSILPRSFEIEGLDISAIMLPATQVGGDYYDVIPHDEGCWIGVGDVAGHGLQTGLVMLMIQSMVSAITGFDASAKPSSAVRALNTALYDNVRQRLLQDEHATFTLLRYERSGRVTFAGGHEDIVVYRASDESVELVPMLGPWIGARREVYEISDAQFELAPDDVMVLFTDGVTEAKNPSYETFGIDRLQRLVRELGQEPVDVIRDRLLAAVLGWAPVLEDDVTLVVLRHLPLPATTEQKS